MSIEIKMPALSPTMEEGTLARWLVKEGDRVTAGDVMAEIETDKATMEFEAVDEGTIGKITVPEGTANVKVGTVIATLESDDEAPAPARAGPAAADEAEVDRAATPEPAPPAATPAPAPNAQASAPVAAAPAKATGRLARVTASPLARRIADQAGIDLTRVKGSGPNGRIVKADLEAAATAAAATPAAAAAGKSAAPATAEMDDRGGAPHAIEPLSNVRKVIARRLTEAKQQIPHIYLTLDIRLDRLLNARAELNAALAPREIKLSVNDLLIAALGRALLQVPKCNVSFAGDVLKVYSRADVSVAVSAPSGLITPIIVDAGTKPISVISTEMKALAEKARAGKLQPHEFQGGTASLSNLGMFGIRQFDAVINPPQAMIMAVGAGEKRAVVSSDAVDIATIMTATGSFDHRAIDGADAAELMKAFQALVENPLGLLA